MPREDGHGAVLMKAYGVYRDVIYKGVELNEVQDTEIRRAFFAGMYEMFLAVNGVANGMSFADASVMLGRFETELREFRDCVKRGEA